MQDLVEKYIAIRDKKAEVAAEYKRKIAKFDALLEAFEAKFLDFFIAQKIDSIGCSTGTVFKTTRTSATVADWDAALEYIKEHDAWQLLERRVAKTAVQEFVDAHNDLPPGVNWRSEVTVQVRRS